MSEFGSSMTRLFRASDVFLYLTFILRLRLSQGGVCWKYQDNTSGLCRTAIVTNMTFEDCCNLRGLPGAAWTANDVTPDVFYLNYLSNGSTDCRRCHRTCDSVSCFPGKKCRMMDGFPTCVCKPSCDQAKKSRGTLCGTNGRTYKHYCHMQRENCKNDQMVSVDYYGKCRGSCKRIQCDNGQHCMQDQNGTPHCVTCSEHCKTFIPEDHTNYLCAENGQTYKNTCDLKADMCKIGRSIRIAHLGQCQENETCENIKCKRGETCLKHSITGRPVCANCKMHCMQTLTLPICGTDRRTYQSYCQMMNHGCRTGVYITAHRQGSCKNVRVKLKAASLKLKETDNANKTKQTKRRKAHRDRKNKRRRQKDRRLRRKHRTHGRHTSQLNRSRRQKVKSSEHHISSKSHDNSRQRRRNIDTENTDNTS